MNIEGFTEKRELIDRHQITARVIEAHDSFKLPDDSSTHFPIKSPLCD